MCVVDSDQKIKKNLLSDSKLFIRVRTLLICCKRKKIMKYILTTFSICNSKVVDQCYGAEIIYLRLWLHFFLIFAPAQLQL